MKICIAVLDEAADGPPTGTDEVVRLNVQAIVDGGGEVAVLMPERRGLRAALSPYTDEFYIIDPATRRGGSVRGTVSALRAFRAIAPSFVHFHAPSYRWGWDAILAARLLRLPVIRTEHNPVMGRPGPIDRHTLRILDGGARAFVYVSAGNQARFEAAFPWRVGRGTVIVNAIDPARFAPLLDTRGEAIERPGYLRQLCGVPPDARIAILVGRGIRVTDHETRRPLGPVLRALAQLDSRSTGGPPWHLAVIGAGDPSHAIEAAQRLGLNGRVHFLGLRRDALELIASSDLLVSASHYEGCAVTFLEAWYAGIPVLSTRVDGIEDIVGAHNLTSLTVPQGDVEAFAALWSQVDDEASPFYRANELAKSVVRSDGMMEQRKRGICGLYDLPARAEQSTAAGVVPG